MRLQLDVIQNLANLSSSLKKMVEFLSPNGDGTEMFVHETDGR